MKTRLFVVAIVLAVLAIFLPNESYSQGEQAFRGKLESILTDFKNYRFSTISVYKISNISDIREIIKEEKQSQLMGSATVDRTCVDNAEEVVKSLIERGVQQNQTKTAIQRTIMIDRGITIDPTDFDCIYNFYFNQYNTVAEITVRNAYVVTTRKSEDEIVPNTIIGLLISDEDKSLKDNLDNANASDIYTLPELQEFDLSDEYSAETLYDLVVNAFQQGNVEDVTLQAQGIGTFITFASKSAGNSRSLISREDDISSIDIQSFKRISEGQPYDLVGKKHEVIISADYISWRKYEFDKYYDQTGVLVVDSLYPTNNMLPSFGLELKYGIADINYPSLWSDRMTLSAIWENASAGIILPSNGWAGIYEDIFKDSERRLTHAGLGLAAEFDFPIAVIPESGVFHFSLGGVFGDAQSMDKDRKTNAQDFDPALYGTEVEGMNDYLVRFNGQFHPTFGITIDDDYLLRFGLGTTFYQVEQWAYQYDTDEDGEEDRSKVVFAEQDSENIFGISGKLEFMKKNSTTPYGATVQYFDSGLFLNLWLMVPVVENTFSIKLDGRGYFKWFADQPRAWENDNVVIPNVRFIVNF